MPLLCTRIFRIAVALSAASALSPVSTLASPAGDPAPGPCLLTVQNGGSQPGVHLTWTNVADEFGYQLYRDGQFLAQFGPDVTTYVDLGYPAPDRTYCIEASYDSGPSPQCCVQVSDTAPAVKVEPWDWFNDTFPFNETATPGYTAAFDTCSSLVKTGRNIAAVTGNQNRYDVPGDSVVVRAPGAARVDLVFRVFPGFGNYVTIGQKSSGLRRRPAQFPAVAITPGDGSFWSRYIDDNGEFGTADGVGVPHAPSVLPHAARWDPNTWNSAQCYSPSTGIFVTQHFGASTEKILPDGLLTPGAHVEYFFRVQISGEVILYPDTSRVLHTKDGDIDGHRWQEFGVLPDRWKSPPATVLFVDLADRFGSERVWAGVTDSIHATASGKYGAHSGWHALGGGADIDAPANNRLADDVTAGFIAHHGGQPGTKWDMYGVKGIESPVTGCAGSLGSRRGFNDPGNTQINDKRSRQGPSLDMLNTFYKTVVVMSGELHQNLVGPDVDRSQNDVQTIQDWLTSGNPFTPNRGIFLSGEGLAEALYGGPGDGFLRDYLGVELVNGDYRLESGVFGNSIQVGTLAPHVPANYDLSNLTPNDVLARSPSLLSETSIAAHYSGAYGASIYKAHSPTHPWVALTDGWDPAKMSGAANQQRLAYFCETLSNASIFGALVAFGSCSGAASISGSVYYDFNLDGDRDPGETGTSGWTIELRNGTTVLRSTVSNVNGEYAFTDVLPGTYLIGEKTEAYWVETAPAGGTHTVTVAASQSLTGKDFGNWQWIPGATICRRPPDGLVAWYPLDEAAGATAHETMGLVNGVWSGGPTAVAGKVDGALSFSGGSHVSVPTDDALDFGTGDFTIDAWVKTSSLGTMPIVDKRTTSGVARGYLLFLTNGKVGFQFSNGVVFPGNFIATGPDLADGLWHHVAASAKRSGTPNVTLYADGVALTTNVIGIQQGDISTTAPLQIGISSNGPFTGAIDEVELFARALSATEVASIYNAGVLGKCKEFCAVPAKLDFCADEQVSANLRIANRSSVTHDYIWTLAGLSVALSGCTNAGPTIFTPTTGRVTLASGASVDIPIAIRGPACPIDGKSFCYQATLVKEDEQIGVISTGALIHATKLCSPCVQVAGGRQESFDGPVDAQAEASGGARSTLAVTGIESLVIPFGTSRRITYSIANRSNTTQSLTYAFTSAAADPGPDATLVSLDGLAPGAQTSPQAVLIPARSNVEVFVDAEFETYDPGALPDVVLLADVDDDTVLDELMSRQVRSARGLGLPTGVGERPTALETGVVRASPNPFESAIQIQFTLASAQQVDARIFDTGGRLVTKLWSGSLAAGTHALRWDGRSGAGARAPAGVYLVRVKTDRGTTRAKVLRMR